MSVKDARTMHVERGGMRSPRHEAGGHVNPFEHSRPRMEQTSRAAHAHELAILRPKAVEAACT